MTLERWSRLVIEVPVCSAQNSAQQTSLVGFGAFCYVGLKRVSEGYSPSVEPSFERRQRYIEGVGCLLIRKTLNIAKNYCDFQVFRKGVYRCIDPTDVPPSNVSG